MQHWTCLPLNKVQKFIKKENQTIKANANTFTIYSTTEKETLLHSAFFNSPVDEVKTSMKNGTVLSWSQTWCYTT